MKRTVGPLDRRKRLTRCQACAKRRIKCEGGFPCKYCIRTNKTCQSQQAAPREVKFVTAKPVRLPAAAILPMQLRTPDDILYLDYFTVFMQRCQFTNGFASISSDLMPLIEASPPLRDLTLAIGALEMSRRGVVESVSRRTPPEYAAFNLYGKSIQALQVRLDFVDALRSEDALWITFFLGLFELLSEPSGDRWVKHMLHGTSQLLQLTGPEKQLSPLSRKLFEAFRFLEISRAIIYGENTFLAQDVWLRREQKLVSVQSDPMEISLQLMLRTSTFSKRLFDEIEAIPDEVRTFHPAMWTLAREGIHIQQQLNDCFQHITSHSNSSDPYTKLALANNHAALLFLCRNYTYYPCWSAIPIPRLTQNEIWSHVTAILNLSDTILKVSAIPGVSLLFPLRMAGAHANEILQREKLITILDQIYQKGFVISERIKVDLRELWKYQATGIEEEMLDI